MSTSVFELFEIGLSFVPIGLSNSLAILLKRSVDRWPQRNLEEEASLEMKAPSLLGFLYFRKNRATLIKQLIVTFAEDFLNFDQNKINPFEERALNSYFV